jgi:uncharacterized protein (DUF3084 family)
MDTTLNPEPRHALIARAEEELSHAHEQITLADEQIARLEEQLSKLDHAARGAVPSKGGRALRGFAGLVLAACICVAAMVQQSSYGDAVRQIITRWTSQFVRTSSLPPEKLGLPAEPSNRD